MHNTQYILHINTVHTLYYDCGSYFNKPYAEYICYVHKYCTSSFCFGMYSVDVCVTF